MHLRERLDQLRQNARLRKASQRADLREAMARGETAGILATLTGAAAPPTPAGAPSEDGRPSIAESASATLYRVVVEPRLRTLVEILDDVAWVSDRREAHGAVYLEDGELGLRTRFEVSVAAEGAQRVLVEAAQTLWEREGPGDLAEGDVGAGDADAGKLDPGYGAASDGTDRIAVAAHPLEEAPVGRFLDDHIVRFMASIEARRRQIASRPENMVTDPVCGMTFVRLDAAAEVMYEGQRYYFCLEACRDRFLADPARYATVF